MKKNYHLAANASAEGMRIERAFVGVWNSKGVGPTGASGLSSASAAPGSPRPGLASLAQTRASGTAPGQLHSVQARRRQTRAPPLVPPCGTNRGWKGHDGMGNTEEVHPSELPFVGIVASTPYGSGPIRSTLHTDTCASPPPVRAPGPIRRASACRICLTPSSTVALLMVVASIGRSSVSPSFLPVKDPSATPALLTPFGVLQADL
jgi:hypothetical protein